MRSPVPHAEQHRSDGFRLTIFCPYPLECAPSQRYRFEHYLPLLRSEGVKVQVHPLLDRRTYGDLQRPGAFLRKGWATLRGFVRRLEEVGAAGKADVVLVHRELFPLGGARLERRLARHGVPMIFDFDDAIYLPHVGSANRWVAGLKRPEKVAEALSLARLVLAGNPHLAGYARQFAGDVRVLPSVIDTDRYRCGPEGGEAVEPPDRPVGPVTIGWTGSPTTVSHLRDIEGVLREVQRRHGVRIRVIGAPDYRPHGLQVESLPWSPDTEVRDLCPVDIGVMPLPDTAWTRGKCGMKLLQYMGLGKAAVASPVGVNAGIVNPGRNGLLAMNEEEWVESLEALIGDMELRRDLGREARRTVQERYSVASSYPLFRKALSDALRA